MSQENNPQPLYSPSSSANSNRQVLYAQQTSNEEPFEELYDTVSIQHDMQERFDDTAQFLSRPHHAESNDQRIDDILLYDASVPVKVDPGVSRPTTASILQPITSNLAIIRPHTGQRPSTGAHTRSGNASIGQRSQVKGSLSETQQLASFVQNVARATPTMGYSSSLKTLLQQGRTSGRLSSLKSELLSGTSTKTPLTPTHLEFGSKCPIPLHPKRSSRMHSGKTLLTKTMGSTGGLQSPASEVVTGRRSIMGRPSTAGSQLQSSKMLKKLLLTESQKGSEVEPETEATTARVRPVVKYRNNDFDNFKTRTTANLLGKVAILRPRLEHSKTKYHKTLKSIRHFERATKEHYEALQNAQSQYRPDEINLIATSQKNVDAVLKANAREDPHSLAHQALRVVHARYYKNSNKPLGTHHPVDYFAKQPSPIPNISATARRSLTASNSSKMLRTFSSQSLYRPHSRGAALPTCSSEAEVSGSCYDENDPEIQQIKQMERNQGPEDGVAYFTDEGEMFAHHVEEQGAAEPKKKAKGKRVPTKKLKLHLNITPRIMQTGGRFYVVGKNVNPKNLRQINETDLIRLQAKRGMLDFPRSAVETQTPAGAQHMPPRSASTSPQLTSDLAQQTHSAELVESMSSMRGLRKGELRHIQSANYSHLAPAFGGQEESAAGTPQLPLSPVNDSQIAGNSVVCDESVVRPRTGASQFAPTSEETGSRWATVFQSRNIEMGEVTEEKEATTLSDEPKPELKSNRRVLLIKDPHRKSGLPTPHGDAGEGGFEKVVAKVQLHSAPGARRQYLSNDTETTYQQEEHYHGVYDNPSHSEELYARWQQDFSCAQGEETKGPHSRQQKPRNRPSLMQLSQVSLPLEEGAPKFTLSDELPRRTDKPPPQYFSEYYEDPPQKPPQEIASQQRAQTAGDTFGNYINTVFPPTNKKRPTSAAYRPGIGGGVSSAIQRRPWSAAQRKRSQEGMRRQASAGGLEDVHLLDIKAMEGRAPGKKRKVGKKVVQLGVFGLGRG